MRKGFTFFRSYYDAVKELPPEQYKESMNAILAYAFDETIPNNLSPVANLAFQLAKPNIEASLKKSEAGRKGGQANAKQTASKVEANVKQSESKDEANTKQTASKVEAIKDKGYRIKDIGYRNLEKENTKEKSADKSASDAEVVDQVDTWFKQFWNEYPKKVSKKDAEKAFKKAFKGKKESYFNEVMDSLRNQNQLKFLPMKQEGRESYIPNGATWLNGERWKDEVVPENQRPVSSGNIFADMLYDMKGEQNGF